MCQDPEADVFDLREGAGAAVGTGGSCDGHTFTVEPADGNGRHRIVPEQPTVLGPADGSGPEPSHCTMDLRLLEVTAVPDTDVQPGVDGVQTRNQVSAHASHPGSGRMADASNTKLVTAFPGQVNLATDSDPSIADGTSPIAPGGDSTDTATITRADPETDPDPTGEVTFELMGPDPDANCTGPTAVVSRGRRNTSWFRA